MKSKLVFGLTLLAFPLMLNAAALELGKSFPSLKEADAKMMGTDGKTYSIDQVRKAGGTLVIFSCNHCPYAVAWENRIASIGNKYSKEWKDTKTGKTMPGVGVIMINSNDPKGNPIDGMDEMKVRAKTLGLNFPYVVDASSNVARAYGASKTPEVFLFDKDGKLVYRGAVDDNHKEADKKEDWLIQAIENMQRGEAIQKADTKAIGCGIKFRS